MRKDDKIKSTEQRTPPPPRPGIYLQEAPGGSWGRDRRAPFNNTLNMQEPISIFWLTTLILHPPFKPTLEGGVSHYLSGILEGEAAHNERIWGKEGGLWYSINLLSDF